MFTSHRLDLVVAIGAEELFISVGEHLLKQMSLTLGADKAVVMPVLILVGQVLC